MSEENVRFVWEGSKTIHFYKAEKFDTWVKMKTRKNSIEKSIKEAKELLDKMRKAGEYGVLTTVIYFDLGSVSFKYVEHENAKLTFTIQAPYDTRKNIREEIKNNPIKAIEKFIENLENELETHKEYMKEAEPYLRISVNF